MTKRHFPTAVAVLPFLAALATTRFPLFMLLLCAPLSIIQAATNDLPDVYSLDAARFTERLSSPSAERRVEGIKGLSHLKYWLAEEEVLDLLDDTSPQVKREALLALGRLGTAKSVPALLKLLNHSTWEIRQNAWLNLRQLTGQPMSADEVSEWNRWWTSGAVTNLQQVRPEAITQANPPISRAAAIRSLRALALPASEPALIQLAQLPGLTLEEYNSVAEALERVGTAQAIPLLARWRTEAAAWALGRIGGAEAESALLHFPPTLAVLINLDRLHSTRCAPLVPWIVSNMGLVTYRSQPDDLMNPDSQPIQRVGANLIRRSGRAEELIHQVLLELEYSMSKPPSEPRPSMPAEWKSMLENMRSELKPGFVREDGVTTSQPITALYHVAEDPALIPRLRPLLHHPAFVPRIYIAMTLAKLQAKEALPALIQIVQEGYAFSDATALASGKHFGQSQTVRWRGFLCMALGYLKCEAARQALEGWALDPAQPRDIRYGSVVGLGFYGSPKSIAALRRVAKQDIIWMTRDEARRALAEIELLSQEAKR